MDLTYHVKVCNSVFLLVLLKYLSNNMALLVQKIGGEKIARPLKNNFFCDFPK